MTSPTLRISLFGFYYSRRQCKNVPTDPTPASVSWAALRTTLSQHRTSDDKTAVPAWSFASYPEGARRLNAYVQSHAGAHLDIDGPGGVGVSLEVVRSIQTQIERLGLVALMHSTYSAAKVAPLVKCRVIVPYAASVPPNEHEATLAAVVEVIGASGIIDTQAVDPARLMYAPSCPESGLHAAWVWTSSGNRFVDPTELARIFRGPTEEKDRIRTPLSREDLERLGKKARQRDSTESLGTALLLALEGKPFAIPNHRDNGATRLTFFLAREYQHEEDIPKLWQILGPSLSSMEIDEANFSSKMRSAVVKLEENRQKTEDKKRAQIREAFKESEPERDTPFMDYEIRDLCERSGWTQEQLAKRWILQIAGTSFCFLCPRPGGRIGYGPIFDSALGATNHAQIALAPATGVAGLRIVDDEGEPRRIEELLLDYGTTLESRGVSYSWIEQETRLIGSRLVVACSPLRRDLDATWDPMFGRIARWMRLMVGESPEGPLGEKTRMLFAWLSTVPDPRRPLCALVLVMRKDQGKSMLVHAVELLWSKLQRAITLRDALLPGGFTDGLLVAPFARQDEAIIPTDPRGRPMSREARDIVSAPSHEVRIKFRDVAHVEGCIRIMCTANSDSGTMFSRHDTQADIEAIDERFRKLEQLDQDLARACREYLDEQGREETSRWYHGGISRFILWLHANQATFVPREWHANRFLLPAGSFASNALLGAPNVQIVMSWLYRVVTSPRPDAAPVRVYKGEPGYLLSTSTIVERWGEYMPDERPPELQVVRVAVAAVTEKISVWHVNSPRKERFVRREMLLQWCESVDFDTSRIPQAPKKEAP